MEYVIAGIFFSIHIVSQFIERLHRIYSFKDMAIDSLVVGGGVALTHAYSTYQNSPIGIALSVLGVIAVTGRVAMIYINVLMKYEDLKLKRHDYEKQENKKDDRSDS